MLTRLRTRKFLAQRADGFTLLELLVVVIVIGILAAIALPVFLNHQRAAIDATTQSDVRNTVGEALGWRALHQGEVPASASAYVTAGGTITKTRTDSQINIQFATDGTYSVCGYDEAGLKYVSGTTAWGYDGTTGKSAGGWGCTENAVTPPTAGGGGTTVPDPSDPNDNGTYLKPSGIKIQECTVESSMSCTGVNWEYTSNSNGVLFTSPDNYTTAEHHVGSAAGSIRSYYGQEFSYSNATVGATYYLDAYIKPDAEASAKFLFGTGSDLSDTSGIVAQTFEPLADGWYHAVAKVVPTTKSFYYTLHGVDASGHRYGGSALYYYDDAKLWLVGQSPYVHAEPTVPAHTQASTCTFETTGEPCTFMTLYSDTPYVTSPVYAGQRALQASSSPTYQFASIYLDNVTAGDKFHLTGYGYRTDKRPWLNFGLDYSGDTHGGDVTTAKQTITDVGGGWYRTDVTVTVTRNSYFALRYGPSDRFYADSGDPSNYRLVGATEDNSPVYFDNISLYKLQ